MARDTLALAHGVKVRAHLMRHLAYPVSVREPGRIVLALELGTNGALRSAEVVERDGAPAQVAAALAAARAAAPYPPAPAALSDAPLAYDIRVSFRRR